MIRKFFLIIVLSIIPLPCSATSYFLNTAAGGGSDANNGLDTGHPWLSPNHPLNCGDTITAAASTAYSAANFGNTKWGTVTCSGSNNVAWLICGTFDGCKITATSNFAMWINKSFWGVQGWEAAETGNNGLCFGVIPTGGATIHHIILANDICNGGANGFASSPQSTTAGVDYLAIVGVIAWNAAQSTILCNSGITIYEPAVFDTAPGTHIYVAGSFSFDNSTPTNCSGGTTTFDGNGIVFDDFGNSQSGGPAYTQQAVIDNNIAVFNGGYGLGLSGNGTQSSRIYIRQNTSVNDLQASNTNTTTCGDVTLIGPVSLTEEFFNLVQTKGATACSGSVSLYALAVYAADSSDHVYKNFIYSAAGNNTTAISSPGFSFGPNNTTGISPAFANIADPGAPSCGGASSVPNCMATMIANFTPTTAAAKPYGYQIPTSASVYDPLFPQWLCTVTSLPAGLVQMGCLQAGALGGGAVLSGGTIH